MFTINYPCYGWTILYYPTRNVLAQPGKFTNKTNINFANKINGPCWERRPILSIYSNGSCKISEIWDLAEPENQNNIPICAELFQRTNSNFLRVFVNENFLILKIFERFKIDLNLLQVTLQEKSI